jgi:uncharacterized membrane protein
MATAIIIICGIIWLIGWFIFFKLYLNTVKKYKADKDKEIKKQNECREKLKSISSDLSELIFYAKNTSSANVSHKMPSIMNRLNEMDKKLKSVLFDDQDDRTEDEKRLHDFMNNHK